MATFFSLPPQCWDYMSVHYVQYHVDKLKETFPLPQIVVHKEKGWLRKKLGVVVSAFNPSTWTEAESKKELKI